MCGIAALIALNPELLHYIIKMTSIISYRGPDDEGSYFERGVALGHRRLAIIDLSPKGHQPMWNKEKTVGTVFNGEIYNYSELKKKLEQGGYVFQSASDTEVIIALYEKYKEECFAMLSGMFAIALYDTKQKKLLLARDPMGKKPLYYGLFKDTLVFASEPKALLTHPLVEKKIDRIALNAYLALDYVPTPMSIYEGIKKIEPAL